MTRLLSMHGALLSSLCDVYGDALTRFAQAAVKTLSH
jgi:hypothetical protein